MMATYTPRPGSKIEKIISFMHANADKDMDTVCAGMLEFVQTNMADCRSYYRWAVKQGIAPGAVAAGRAKSAPKPAVERTVKRMAAEVVAKTKEVRPETLLPASEVEKIKAANLARLKSVSARVNKLRGDTVVPVAMSEDEYDTFSVPAFLRKDELKVLI
jgi:tRNA U34 5-carboxymethylaminomethyl modifying enzyme MnmG/GidA